MANQIQEKHNQIKAEIILHGKNTLTGFISCFSNFEVYAGRILFKA